ncbi:MAG: hypothetical protein ACYC8T_36390 [Myxococcaceae bacterium]
MRRIAMLLGVLAAAAALPARAQHCPSSVSVQCPGSTTASCGSLCDGQITFTAHVSCACKGCTPTCTLTASNGQSCGNCSCTLTVTCPCKNQCGADCLDGTTHQCCNGKPMAAGDTCCPDGHGCGSGDECCGAGCMPGGSVCCGDQAYEAGAVCCGDKAYEAGAVCCAGGFACKAGGECCANGVEACVEPGGSCCSDGIHYCPHGSDCVGTTCCPRMTPESSPFTAYDGTTGYCCGDSSCAATGGCEGGAGICACAHSCNGLCCPDGTACCPSKGWCAPEATGCPVCPPGYPVDCDDGTCAPSGAICCGKGLFCPNGLSCADCGGGVTCCGGGPVEQRPHATATSAPAIPDGGGAINSHRAAQSNGPADKSTLGQPGSATALGCGGGGGGGTSPSPGGGSLGLGYACGCSSGGGVLGLGALAILEALRALSRRRRVARRTPGDHR